MALGVGRRIGAGLDLWPTSVTWAPDGSALFVLADRQGATSVFRLDLATDEVTLLAGDGSYTDLCPTPDGTDALRALLAPRPAAVRGPPRRPRRRTRPRPRSPPPSSRPDLPRRGVVERVRHDRRRRRRDRRLAHPPGSRPRPGRPVPLVTFVHGGPLGSWTGWHWRWNAHILVERGYAVLMPDPAFSTGYGQRMIERGWGAWHERPYTDVMAAVDAAIARPDIDAERTALMGGSFGGYMANWVAGHTDRFRAIVTHASLWDLRGFHGSTDHGPWWEQEFGDPYVDPSRYLEQSPSAVHRRHHDADAGHPRRAGPPRPDQRGAPPVDRPLASRRRGQVPLLPRREPLDPEAATTHASGTGPCWPSSTSTSSAANGSGRSSSEAAAAVRVSGRRLAPANRSTPRPVQEAPALR